MATAQAVITKGLIAVVDGTARAKSQTGVGDIAGIYLPGGYRQQKDGQKPR